MLKAGLAAAAVGAVGTRADALPEAQSWQAGATGQSSSVTPARVRAIDIHAHYYPESYLNVIGEFGGRFGGDYHMTETGPYVTTPRAGGQGQLARKFTDLKLRIADMDAQGIATQAISLTAPMVYWGDADFNHRLAMAWNDGASAAHQAYPSRIVALATLPMLDPDRAIDELNRASKLPGIRGIYMGTNINDKDLDDPLFEPVWARIEKAGLPVFLHPLQTIGGERLGKYYLSNLIGNPVDGTIAACRLIFGGVLDRHPSLQINLPHAGGVLPILIGRIDHGWQVRPETKSLANAPSTYLRRFTYDTISHSKRILEFVIAEVGAERMMIGSDYCFDMGIDRPVQVVEELNLSASQRKMVLGGTAARILKL
jgi:aminocarboxymuconate-semialdehyde decarboxylase